LLRRSDVTDPGLNPLWEVPVEVGDWATPLWTKPTVTLS